MTIIEITPTDAAAELERRTVRKADRSAATNRYAASLGAVMLREIAAEIASTPIAAVTFAPVVTPAKVTVAKVAKVTGPVAPVTFVDTLVAGSPEFTVETADLAAALKVLVASKRNGSLPILAGVAISVEGGTATLTTTDLDVTMQLRIAAEITTPGSVVVSHSMLKGLLPTAVKNQVGSTVLKAADDSVTVTVGSATSELRRSQTGDWPRLVAPETGEAFELDLVALASVVKSARVETDRPILSGVLFTGNSVVTTDTYRLAICESAMTVDTPILLPATFVVGLLKRAKRAIMAVSADQVVVTDETGLVCISRLIDGQFPNYLALIPSSTEHSITFDPAEMNAALMTLLRSKPSPSTPVRFTPGEGGTFGLTMIETDRATVNVTVKGTCPIMVAFNPKYIMELLTAGGFDELRVIDALKPSIGVRTDQAGRVLRHLIMPVRIK